MNEAEASDWQHDFRRWLTHTTSSVDDVVDAGIRRLRRRLGRSGIPKIQPYIGYASQTTIRLHGRVLTNPPIDPDFRTDRWWKNLSNTIQRFASDEVPSVAVSAVADGRLGSTISDAEGYFFVDVPRDPDNGNDLFWSPARLRIEGHAAVTPEGSGTACEVMYVPPTAKYAVISDVDDTILHTGATEIATMAKLTFFGNARTRAPLDGVAKLYQLMQCQGDEFAAPINPIFYVSSSPWNLYDLLEDFLELNAIPKGPLLLRDLGFDSNKFLKNGHDHKLDKTRALMNLFADLPFVLIGDSGQEDARLYAQAAQEYGSRIRAVFIRDIDPGTDSRHDQKVDRSVECSRSAGVPMYRVRNSIEVARLAIDHGLLPPHSLADVTRATLDDQSRKTGML